MSAKQSKYWLSAASRWSKRLLQFSGVLLLSACANNPDWIALENLPANGGATDRERQASVPSRPSSSTSPGTSQSAGTPPPPRQEENLPDRYRVQRGDTLYSISFRYARDFREVAEANNIPEPYTIVPGQELDMRATATSRDTPSSSASSSSSGSQPAPSRPSEASEDRQIAAAPITPPPADPNAVANWIWPVEGNIVRAFSDGASGSKGIDIDAPLGESVRAAADGKVVYAGDGLRGYGNLIILEHPGRMLSAYAHTRTINVDEQQEVSQGEVIAEVGNRGDTPLLHFEIRQEGKPVDPVGFLPRR
ncbi:MAG: peptidoglycan DD-metalloendopeptidase family protein [Natronospirillum sp.]|uniref:peptidoglycan DD-metalloendopeptidase family protein n=1 Tax=Natronospirillum sp. TaxID=2812955 RepID=UPI002601246D|nr:peptidoglycan DD-metalloendopeptidase family protein [Natronospirillum sp.]MCH8551605.1 peptidoglycan DD-metalloendopeptidase family protein [Natronospirillum sp.]